MTLTAFADSVTGLTPFYQAWNINRSFARPVSVRCSQCDTVLPLVIGSDTEIDDHDTKIFLLLEVLSRGWQAKGNPLCPKCR
jgi:hypothetical protein